MSVKDMQYVTVEQVLALREEAMRLEVERDEWKQQANAEAVVADSYRDERDALAAHHAKSTILINRLFRCDDYSANGEGDGTTDGTLVPTDLMSELADLSDEAPSASLAKRDARVAAGALLVAAGMANAKTASQLMALADQYACGQRGSNK